jgi:microcompartment protein CcmL/EutN
LDALVKEAPVQVVEANLIEPGKFLILFGGGVAEVEASFHVGKAESAEELLDTVFLPLIEPRVWGGLEGSLDIQDPDTVGVVEGRSIAGVLEACDAALKSAFVGLCGLRVMGALGGKGFFVVHGKQHDVDAALEAGKGILEKRGSLQKVERIGRPHPEFLVWLLKPAGFTVGKR